MGALLKSFSRIEYHKRIALEYPGLVRSTAELPGRKLLFVISDGFYLDERSSDVVERLRSITTAAARSGIVIYSIDGRGLISGTPDASDPGTFDPSGRVQRAGLGAIMPHKMGSIRWQLTLGAGSL